MMKRWFENKEVTEGYLVVALMRKSLSPCDASISAISASVKARGRYCTAALRGYFHSVCIGVSLRYGTACNTTAPHFEARNSRPGFDSRL